MNDACRCIRQAGGNWNRPSGASRKSVATTSAGDMPVKSSLRAKVPKVSMAFTTSGLSKGISFATQAS